MTAALPQVKLPLPLALLAIAWSIAVAGWIQLLPVEHAALALALTIGIEAPLLLLLLRPAPEQRAQVLLTGILINGFTHPLVWTAIERRWMTWTVAELFAFTAEAILIRLLLKPSWPMAIVASLCANAVTAAFGLLVRLP